MPKRSYPHRKKPEYDHAVHKVLNRLRDRSASAIARDCYVSASTIRNWRKPYAEGGVRYPQFINLQEVARVAGLRFELLPIAGSNRPATPHPQRKPKKT